MQAGSPSGEKLRLEERIIGGRYRVQLVYEGDDLIGAFVEVPTLGRIYIARRDRVVVPRLSKKVKKFLAKYGFQVL